MRRLDYKVARHVWAVRVSVLATYGLFKSVVKTVWHTHKLCLSPAAPRQGDRLVLKAVLEINFGPKGQDAEDAIVLPVLPMEA